MREFGKQFRCILLAVLMLAVLPLQAQEAYQAYRDSALPIEDRVADLLQRMTVEEKIAELCIVQDPRLEEAGSAACGMVFGVRGSARCRIFQTARLRGSRLGIPLLFCGDLSHGFRTVFPIPLAMAASWDKELIRRSTAAMAKEAAASGLHLLVMPGTDVTDDPRHGCVGKSAGEDPYLASIVAAAAVEGIQGKELNGHPNHAAVCLRRFIAAGASFGGREFHTGAVSERALRERYLPPFRRAIDAGAAAVMCAPTPYNGIPMIFEPYLLRSLLRHELGFRGPVLSDRDALNRAVELGAAADGTEAATRALRSGVDADRASGCFASGLRQGIDAGRVSLPMLDAAVARVLELKFRMRLFEDPFAFCSEVREQHEQGSADIRALAFRMACGSMVLLKNSNSLLPLKHVSGHSFAETPGEVAPSAPNAAETDADGADTPPAPTKLALVGPFVENRLSLQGGWTPESRPTEVITVAEGMRDRIPEERLTMAGCVLRGVTEDYLKSLSKRLENASVIVACLGGNVHALGESRSGATLELPSDQLKLLRFLKTLNKPIVTVLFSDRPLVLEEVVFLSDAVLMAWQPGTLGGAAVAALLMGETSPSGRLPMTFPRHAGQIPMRYSTRRTCDPEGYFDVKNGPLFPFGFGLGYSTFTYSNPVPAKPVYACGDMAEVSVDITNSGNVTADEVMQVYISDETASIVPRERELRGFHKLRLQPGEKETVRFMLPPTAFSLWDPAMRYVVEPGSFTIRIGSASDSTKDVRLRFE